MMFPAEPTNIKRLGVVQVVSFGFNRSTYLTLHPNDSSGFDGIAQQALRFALLIRRRLAVPEWRGRFLSAVGSLCFAVRPSDVARFITLRVVDSIKRESGGARPKMSEETFKCLKFACYRYSACAISLENLPVGILTTALHPLPNAIFARIAFAVTAVSFGNFKVLLTATRKGSASY